MFESASYYGLSCRARDAARPDPALAALARSWDGSSATAAQALAIVDLIEAVTGGGPLAVLDLACATGSLSRCVLRRFRDARVTGVEGDPVLLMLATHHLAPFGDRCRLVAADPAGPSWVRAVAGEIPTIGVCATPPACASGAGLDVVYEQVASVLPPGGLFVTRVGPCGSPPEGWWARAAAHPALAPLMAAPVRADDRSGAPPDAAAHVEAMVAAGFHGVTTERHHDVELLLARR